MSKKRNNYNWKTDYTNYSKPVEEKEIEEVVPETEEEVLEPEIFPEEKIEKKDELPKNGIVETNLYIRETPYGEKIRKDELEMQLAQKVIEGKEGVAIAPKDLIIDIYDKVDHEDGSVWYNSQYGYLMAKNKDGKEFIK